ncbi:MAG: phospholipid carrier-dependent glycosyltransferase [Acidobacteria bacterium]|nr:phospholipid carrier-dependent glycosyltransferase [Acidobacteriota bacterium]
MVATAKAQQSNNPTAAIVFAVFAIVCVVTFLLYRGSDVGQLPRLTGNLGGSHYVGADIVNDSVGVFVACMIVVSWFGVGAFATAQVRNSLAHSRLFQIVLDTAIGAAVTSLALFVTGLSGTFSLGAALGVLLPGLVWAPFAVAQLIAIEFPAESKKPPHRSLISVLIVTAILLTLISALAPPIAKDALLYHFSVPKAFVAQHSSGFVGGNIASYLAMGTEMHYVWAMLLGGLCSPRTAEAAAGATGFLFLPLLLMTVYGWTRELKLSRNWALLATAIVATVPTAYHVASSGYIDLSLALYVTLATYSLTRWWKEQSWGWAIMIAIFLGAALSVKLTAVFAFAAFALIVLLRARDQVATAPGLDKKDAPDNTEAVSARSNGAGRAVLKGFGALLLAGVIASPWYIRTWIATGSPVFPFYMNIWPGHASGWDVERSNLFQEMNSQYGDVDKNKLNLVTAPVRASIAAQPEQPANYDGVLGVAFLIGLPLLIWALWKFDLAVEIKIAVGVAGVLYLSWLFSSEQLRYLLPILPLLAIGIVASGEAISKTRESLGKVLRYSLIAASACGLLTSFAWFCQKAPLRVVLGGETRDEYLTRNLDYYPYYKEINTNTDPSSRVWLINMRRDTYYIDRPVVSDYLFEDWTLRQMLWSTRSVEELRARAAAMNVQYVLARHDFLFDYDKSTLVDDKRSRAENEAKLNIAKAFLLDPARTVKSDDKFSLVKVF